jgi:hypothetical protein
MRRSGLYRRDRRPRVRRPCRRREDLRIDPRAAQDTSDSAIVARIKVALAGDAGTSTAGTDSTVVAGVKSVKSFIQLEP